MIMAKHLDELENKLFTVEETVEETREKIITLTGESACGVGTIECPTGNMSRRSRRSDWK